MKEVPAIVAEAKVDVAGEVSDAKLSWKRLDGMETAARELPGERLVMGRRLVSLRRHWPTSGPKAKGWGDALKKIGIPERTARDYMALAGYVDEQSEIPASLAEISGAEIVDRDITSEKIPTHAEVKKAKADKKAKIDGAKQTHDHPPAKAEPPAVDAPTPQPVATEKHAPKEQPEIVAGRDAQLVHLVERINALSPPDRLRLAAELLENQRAAEAYKIAGQVVAELGAAMALSHVFPEQGAAA